LASALFLNFKLTIKMVVIELPYISRYEVKWQNAISQHLIMTHHSKLKIIYLNIKRTDLVCIDTSSVLPVSNLYRHVLKVLCRSFV